jgi:hypothetical protein
VRAPVQQAVLGRRDREDIADFVDACMASVADALASRSPPSCGGGLLATGQTTCWDTAGASVPCAETGQDGDLLRGLPLRYGGNGDGTITDVNTGVRWTPGLDDIGNTGTWNDAFAHIAAALNGGTGFAGFNDWRLPNARELYTLINYEFWNPTISAAFNNACADGCTVLTGSCAFPTITTRRPRRRIRPTARAPWPSISSEASPP